jgi:hypothetical protein
MGEEWEKPYFSRVFHMERQLPMQQNRIRLTV